jgi:hypothetical protein
MQQMGVALPIFLQAAKESQEALKVGMAATLKRDALMAGLFEHIMGQQAPK